MMNQGEFLQDARARARLTQKYVAEQALVNERTVMRAEKDQQISRENLVAICLVLGVSPDDVPRRTGTETEAVATDDEAGPSEPEAAGRRIPVWLPRMFAPANLTAALLFGWFWMSVFPYDSVYARLLPGIFFSFQETGIARQTEALLGRIADDVAKDPDAVDIVDVDARMRRSGLLIECPEFGRTGCAGSKGSAVRIEGGVGIVLGPTDTPLMFANILRGLPRTDDLIVEAATTPSIDAPPAGWLWFDPRGLSDGQIPGDEPARFLHLRLRKGDAR